MKTHTEKARALKVPQTQMPHAYDINKTVDWLAVEYGRIQKWFILPGTGFQNDLDKASSVLRGISFAASLERAPG